MLGRTFFEEVFVVLLCLGGVFLRSVRACGSGTPGNNVGGLFSKHALIDYHHHHHTHYEQVERKLLLHI